MRRHGLFPLLAIIFLSAGVAAEDKPPEGFTSLFNGRTLEGWEQRNGTATYRVEEGVIVGKTNEGSPNSFLCSTKDYGDFELLFEVKVDDALNSGVQIRSKTEGGKKEGRVQGPQVEIAINGTAGFIYGEGLKTGWVSTTEEMGNDKAKVAFKKGEWNRYRVVAKGTSIKTWVNDLPVADTSDTKTGHSTGFIGLQVHGIKKGTGPYEVRWRNLSLKELK